MLLGSHLACLGMPFSSARGPAIPSLGNPAHVRNRRPTCETAGSHAGHVEAQAAVAHSQSMTDHGAATHTGPRRSIHRNTANTTNYNHDFPAPHSRQITTPATRCVHPSAYRTCRVAGFVPCVPWYALLVRTWACYSEPGLSHPHVDPLFRTWATPPTCGTGGPRAKQRVHMRDALEPRSLSHTANP